MLNRVKKIFIFLTINCFLFSSPKVTAKEKSYENGLDRPYLPQKTMWEGTKRLSDHDSLVILGVGSFLTLSSLFLDEKLNTLYSDHDPWKNVDGFGNEILGTGIVGVTLSGSLLGLGYLGDRPREIQAGQAQLESLISSFIVTSTLKITVQRKRPSGTNNWSFPSGHTSTIFASAMSLHIMYENPALDFLMFGLGLYTGYSRITSHNHYLSDVVFGATVGLVTGYAFSIVHKEDLKKRNLFAKNLHFGWIAKEDSLGVSLSYHL